MTDATVKDVEKLQAESNIPIQKYPYWEPIYCRKCGGIAGYIGPAFNGQLIEVICNKCVKARIENHEV